MRHEFWRNVWYWVWWQWKFVYLWYCSDVVSFLFDFWVLEEIEILWCVCGDREACTYAPILKEQAATLVPYIARFISFCVPEQIRLAPDKCMYFFFFRCNCIWWEECDQSTCTTLVHVIYCWVQLYLFVRGSRTRSCWLRRQFGGWLRCCQLFRNLAVPQNIWLVCIQSFFLFVCWQSATKLACPFWRMIYLKSISQETFSSTVIMGELLLLLSIRLPLYIWEFSLLLWWSAFETLTVSFDTCNHVPLSFLVTFLSYLSFYFLYGCIQ